MSDAIDAKPVAGASVGPVVTSYKTYATRFIVALVFCLSSAMSSYILATFVTVWDLSMEFFGVDSMGINAFLLVYMAFFLPGSILSVYLMERYGLSTTVTVGALGNMVCCWWRFGGSMIGDDNTQARYAMVLTGQIIAALAQPALLNSPPRIANDWFPPHERDYAMWLTTQANTIGNAIGCLLPAYQVAVAHDIPYMLLWQAVAATGIVLLQLAFFRSARPPTPPAADVALQLEARAALGATATASVMSTLRQMAADTRTVLRNRTFLLILASFSVTIGINWSFGALVGQMVLPCGYDYKTIGASGAGLLFAGVFGAALVSPLLARYRDYSTIQKVYTVLSMGAAIWVLGTGVPNAQEHLLASWLIYGMIVTPIVPIALEHAAEVTYPVPADVSAALLFFGTNALCFALTLGLGDLLAKYDVSQACSSVVTPFSALVFFFVIIGALLILPVKSRYARAEANAAAEAKAAEGAASGKAAEAVETASATEDPAEPIKATVA